MKLFSLLITLLVLFANIFSGTVYLTLSDYGMADEQFFNPNARDGATLPFIALREEIRKRGHSCSMLKPSMKTFDKSSWFICCDTPTNKKIAKIIKKHKKNSILIMWEPPATYSANYNKKAHRHFKAVFTLFHEMVDRNKYFPLYYPQPYLYVSDVVPFNDKKLCTLIAGNKHSSHPQELYSQRHAAISFFEQRAPFEFDFYGTEWSNYEHPCYKGPIEHKLPYLRTYKFAICYENMISKTYITEKIFDCMHAGCVPVYWGAQDICNYIPQKAYILRKDFNSDEELYSFLKSMTEAEYQTYIDAADEFFKSSKAKNFAIESFTEKIVKALFD